MAISCYFEFFVFSAHFVYRHVPPGEYRDEAQVHWCQAVHYAIGDSVGPYCLSPTLNWFLLMSVFLAVIIHKSEI